MGGGIAHLVPVLPLTFTSPPDFKKLFTARLSPSPAALRKAVTWICKTRNDVETVAKQGRPLPILNRIKVAWSILLIRPTYRNEAVKEVNHCPTLSTSNRRDRVVILLLV